jgi:hypothetical protein
MLLLLLLLLVVVVVGRLAVYGKGGREGGREGQKACRHQHDRE